MKDTPCASLGHQTLKLLHPIAHPRTASLVSLQGAPCSLCPLWLTFRLASFHGAKAGHATALGGGAGHGIFFEIG